MKELIRKEHEMKRQRAHDRCKIETSQVYSNAVTEKGILLKDVFLKKQPNNKENQTHTHTKLPNQQNPEK